MQFDLVPVVTGMAIGIAFIVLISLTFAGGIPTLNPSGNVVITLDRTACFGFCPDYSLVIYGNGTVQYDGRNFVAVPGEYESQISKQDVDELLKRANAIGYFGLRNEYTEPITDIPTITTSISIGKITKKIINHAGAPEALTEFENMIDRVAGSDKWVKCPDGELLGVQEGPCP